MVRIQSFQQSRFLQLKMIGFRQIESQFNNKFLPNMILFRFFIVSALLFACANAELDKLIEVLINAVKDNLNFWTILGASAPAVPSKFLLSIPGSSPINSKPLVDGQSQGSNLEEQLNLLQSFRGMTTQSVMVI